MTGTLLFAASAVSARADFMFDLNSLSAYTGSDNNSAAIANYLNGVLGCVNCVTVTGAVTDRAYNGENHVVGPSGYSRTLGNTDGATDNSSSATSTLNGTLSFDYEIFPDNTCPDKWHCGSPLNPPDFKFAVNGNSASPIFTTYGVFPSTSGSNGSSTDSPNAGTTEYAAQYIGTWSGTVQNVTGLDFIDWPAAIGVDNIHYTSTVPEPRGGAILIGGVLLAAVAGMKLRQSLARSLAQ